MKLLTANEANKLYGNLTGKPYTKPYSLFEAMRRRNIGRITTKKVGPCTLQAVTEAQVRAFAKSKQEQPIQNLRPVAASSITIAAQASSGKRRGRPKSALKRAQKIAAGGRYVAEQHEGYVYLRRVADCPALFDDEEYLLEVRMK